MPKAASNRYLYLFSYDTVELKWYCIKTDTQHIIWGRGGESPKAASNRCPYLFSCDTVELKWYCIKTDTQHIIWGRGDDHVYNISSDYRW